MRSYGVDFILTKYLDDIIEGSEEYYLCNSAVYSFYNIKKANKER